MSLSSSPAAATTPAGNPVVAPSIVTQTVYLGPTAPVDSGAGASSTPLPIGAIVGGTLAGILIVLIAVGGWMYWGHQLKKQEAARKAAKATHLPLTHARSSSYNSKRTSHSSFWPKEAKSSLSFEIIAAPGGTPASLPTLSKHGPRSSRPRSQATPAVTVVPPPPSAKRARRARPPLSPPVASGSGLSAGTAAPAGSHSSFRPSPLRDGESFSPPMSPTPPKPTLPPSLAMRLASSARRASSSQSNTSASLSASNTSSPSPPRSPTSPTSPTYPNPSAPRTSSPLASLHAAATRAPPPAFLTLPPSGRSRLSAMSMPPASPTESEGPVGVAYSKDTPDTPTEEEETIWRGSRYEE